MYRLLTVDDDETVLDANKIYFTEQGFMVDTAQRVRQAMALISSTTYDCIILDVRIGREDGYELCKRLKQVADVPVIFLTNLRQEDDLLHGFLCGGDDYIVKPYSLRELKARILARIKQAHSRDQLPDTLCFPPLTINLSSKQAFVRSKMVPLTACEFDILALLAENKNKSFTQSEIYQHIWNAPDLGDPHTVQVHIGQVRKKLNNACPEKMFIRTLWGKGYIFVTEES